MIETLSLIAFILAIAFVAFAAPKRSDPPKRPPQGSDENKKDSDSAKDLPDK